jgi:hypothetical protein
VWGCVFTEKNLPFPNIYLCPSLSPIPYPTVNHAGEKSSGRGRDHLSLILFTFPSCE